MTKKKIAFIAATALFALGILPGAVMNLAQPPMVVDMMAKLELPLHLLKLVGMWKLLGVVALAAPLRFERLKEWAYAGFFFDLTGGAFMHAAVGDMVGAVPALLLLALLMVSYRLRAAVSVDADEPSSTLPAPDALASA